MICLGHSTAPCATACTTRNSKVNPHATMIRCLCTHQLLIFRFLKIKAYNPALWFSHFMIDTKAVGENTLHDSSQTRCPTEELHPVASSEWQRRGKTVRVAIIRIMMLIFVRHRSTKLPLPATVSVRSLCFVLILRVALVAVGDTTNMLSRAVLVCALAQVVVEADVLPLRCLVAHSMKSLRHWLAPIL